MRLILVAISLCVAAAACGAALADDAFGPTMASKAAELQKASAPGIVGQDGFVFLTSELRHYGRGPFWGENAARNTAADSNQDPLACILDFQAQLKKAGVKLIFVPVPGKAAIYPDKLDAKLPAAAPTTPHHAFYDLLQKDGIEVVDLMPDLIEMRKSGTLTHCRQDAHWTPAAMKRAASRSADLVRKLPWVAEMKKKTPRLTPETVKFAGDTVALMEALNGKKLNLPPEEATVERVTLDGEKVQRDRQSPLLVVGDSHCLVYHEPIEGGISATSAGLVDHLAAELGFAPDMVANLGGGANAPRIELSRRRDNLAGKKCIIWCLSVRELTESDSGWMKCPVVR